MPEASFDPGRILAVLDQHNVEYILVGGLGARAHGALRPTSDIDCVPEGGLANLGRLADALSELDARLRVGGMTDDEARQLPVQLDAETLLSFGSSTWMTDAGPIDVLRELRDRDGRDVPCDVLRRRCADGLQMLIVPTRRCPGPTDPGRSAPDENHHATPFT